MRGREGVLVKHRYKRYLFESTEELSEYIEMMDRGEEIKGQRKVKYGVSLRWKKLICWGLVRGIGYVEEYMDRGFRKYVVANLVNFTLNAHKPPS